MAIDPAPLSVTDSVEDLADWLEIRTFRDRDGNSSHVELLKALRMSGTRDALDEEDETNAAIESWEDPYEAAVESAFTEIEDRFNACGAKRGMYPFALEADYIAQGSDTLASVYTFLLLLSRYGGSAGRKPAQGAKFFEEVCAKAAEEYIGGANANVTVKSRVFGFPRRMLPSGFEEALQKLCDELQEGTGPRNRPSSRDQKDAKLDIVAWRDFDDARPGKLITFGQCATGRNWNQKLSDLQPREWCGFWMRDQPAVLPMRMFFVPHRVSRRDWLQSSFSGGVLFDRCRIARHSSLIGPPLRKELAAWSKDVLTNIGEV
jgi:hypothetical protein